MSSKLGESMKGTRSMEGDRAHQTQSLETAGRYALLALAVLASLAALKWSQDVSLPITAAVLAATACFPMFRWLSPRITKVGAVLVCTLTVTAFVGIVCAGLAWSGKLIADHFSSRQDEFAKLSQELLQTMGIEAESLRDEIRAAGQTAASSIAKGLTGLVLAVAITSLFLFDTSFLRRWYGRRSSTFQAVAIGWQEVSRDLARYVIVRSGVGALTGVFTWLACLALDIRLAAVWGFINFLLNYIPTIGSVLGVIPPVVFTFLATGDVAQAGLALAAVGSIQLVMGNWIDPLLQGKYLEIAPSVVLVAVTFWGWVWGPGGALVAVPLCMAFIRLAERSNTTRPLALLLAKRDPTESTRSSPGRSSRATHD